MANLPDIQIGNTNKRMSTRPGYILLKYHGGPKNGLYYSLLEIHCRVNTPVMIEQPTYSMFMYGLIETYQRDVIKAIFSSHHLYIIKKDEHDEYYLKYEGEIK